MRGWGIVAFFCVFSSTAQAVQTPRSAAEYCALVKDLNQFKELAADRDNLMAFANEGGLANGGVCWWHARFQRAGLYLSIFRPELPKNFEASRKAIDDLVGKRRVVEIPGYANFREFTDEWQSVIQDRLEKWQITDGFVKQKWVDGLWGGTHASPEDFEKAMDRLYQRVTDRHEIVYEKLQMPGIVSHAWLVVKMTKTSEGYDLDVLDSNEYGLQRYAFRRGMTSYDYAGWGDFVDYSRNDGELVDIQVEMLRFCNRPLAIKRWESVLMRAYGNDRSLRPLIELNLRNAREKGEFSDILRKQTITEKDREPANWARLFE